MYLKLSDVESNCTFSQIMPHSLFSGILSSVSDFFFIIACIILWMSSSRLSHPSVDHYQERKFIWPYFDYISGETLWKFNMQQLITPHNTAPAQRWAMSATYPWNFDGLIYFHIARRSSGLLGKRIQMSDNNILHRDIKWYDVKRRFLRSLNRCWRWYLAVDI